MVCQSRQRKSSGRNLQEIKEAYEDKNNSDHTVKGSRSGSVEPQSGPLVVLLYKRKSSPDEHVLQYLSEGLTAKDIASLLIGI